MKKEPKNVCVLGHHELDYPRNQSIQKALQLAGCNTCLCHSRIAFPWRHFVLVYKYLKQRKNIDWIFVTEGGHRLVPFLKIFAWTFNHKIIFDPFISRYNTRIEDRKLYKPWGIQALICLWQDYSSTHAADILIFDTLEHKKYFYNKYNLNKPYVIIPVGIDESIFHLDTQSKQNYPSPFAGNTFNVLFYGSYIPLQGIEWIVEAAMTLQNQKIHFTLIGSGQTFSAIKNKIETLGLQNIQLVNPVPTHQLIPYILHADTCLGIFGNSNKAANVVPNKVVQTAAMGKAIITRDSLAIQNYFTHQENILLVPPASGKCIADAIIQLYSQPDMLRKISLNTCSVYKKYFSMAQHSEIIKNDLLPLLQQQE